VSTVGRELRELAEQFPDRRDTAVEGGREQRRVARTALKELVLSLRRIALPPRGALRRSGSRIPKYCNLIFAAFPCC